MSDLANSYDLNTSPRKNKTTLLKYLKEQLPYIAPVIFIILLWILTTQALYLTIDAPEIKVSQRATKFAAEMISKILIFLGSLMTFKLLSFLVKKESNLIGKIFNSFKEFKEDTTKLLRWFVMLAVACISFVLIQTNFMAIKTIIPDIQPFYLDETFHALDRMLFLGTDPWKVFAWMFNYPWVINVIDGLYDIWAPLLACVWIYAFTSKRISSLRRYQYIYGMIFIWLIGGNVLATMLASAGPCYYDVFTGHNTYLPLMDLLTIQHEKMPLGAFAYQDYLLDIYNNKNSRFAGISAAPSLHCATTFMLPIFFWKNKILRYALVTFSVAIFIGSIVLAWHYVMDGLIAIPLVVLCWWMGGKLSQFIHRRFPTPNSPALQ